MQNRLMKKFFLISIFVIFIFTPVSVGAQNSTPAGQQNRIEVKERIDQKEIEKEDARLEIQNRIEERKALQEARLAQQKAIRVRNHWQILEKRIAATIERLKTLITRIESRLYKIAQEEPSLDTTTIQTNIDEAKELLDDAEYLLDNAEVDLETLLVSEDPKTALLELKDTIRDIKDLLIETHRILVHVIGDIKGLRVGSGVITPVISPTPIMNTEASPTVIE